MILFLALEIPTTMIVRFFSLAKSFVPRLPPQTRLSIYFILLSFFASLVPSYVLFLFAVDQTLDSTGRKLASVAAVAALQIDGDLHARVQGTGSDYDAIMEQMRRILHVNTDQSIVHVYSLRKAPPEDDGEVRETEFAVDSAKVSDFPWLAPEDIAPYGKRYCLDEGMKSAFRGIPGSTANLYRNGCGVWRTGYAPIRTRDGTVDAVLCIDGSVLDEDQRLLELRNLCQALVLSAMVIAFFFSLLAGRWLIPRL